MKLQYGGGYKSAFAHINEDKLKIYEYNGLTADEIHERFGGKQYYRSRSGASGAGYVPDSPDVRPVNAYRVDTRYPWFPNSAQWTLPELKVFYPFHYQANIENYGKIWADGYDNQSTYPIIVCYKDIYYFEYTVDFQIPVEQPDTEVFEIAYQVPHYSDKNILINKSKEFKIVNASETPPRIIRRCLEGIHHKDMRVETDYETNSFWARLGLYWTDNRSSLVKITNGIIRQVYPANIVDSISEFQKIVPANVKILDSNCYVQEEEYVFMFVVRETIDGKEYEFEKTLVKPEKIVRVLSGNWDPELDYCLEGIQAKYEHEVEWQKQQELEERFKNRFGELVEKYGDREVTIADSLAVGNCEVATREFSKKHFGGRDSVTIRELAKFKDTAGVWKILRYKLKEFENEK